MGLVGFLLGHLDESKIDRINQYNKDDIWSVTIKLATWNKLYAIHDWVLFNCEVEDKVEMTWEDLDNLRSLCKQKSKEEIPKIPIDSDEEWWEEELEEAIKTIDKIEEFKDDFSHFSYESSW